MGRRRIWLSKKLGLRNEGGKRGKKDASDGAEPNFLLHIVDGLSEIVEERKIRGRRTKLLERVTHINQRSKPLIA